MPEQLPVRAVIFDMDGVLVDTIPLHYRSWQTMMTELGVPFSREMNETLRGLSRRASLKKILGERYEELSEERVQEIMRRKNEMFLEEADRIGPGDAMPGTRALLRELKAAGYRLAVASSSRNARRIVGRLGIRALFDAFVDGNDLSAGKPDPEVFLMAAKQLDVAPAECVVLEDAEAGVEAAHRAGMACIGVGRDLSDAELVVESLAELDAQRIADVGRGG